VRSRFTKNPVSGRKQRCFPLPVFCDQKGNPVPSKLKLSVWVFDYKKKIRSGVKNASKVFGLSRYPLARLPVKI
jgi:hypothetical protein